MARAIDPAGGQPDAAARQLDRAFAKEEESGLRVATHGRAVAFAIILVLAAFFVGYPAALYVQAFLVLFIALGYLHYAVARRRGRMVWRYGLVFLDFALLSLMLFLPNPLDPSPEPGQMLLRHGLFGYYIFVAVVMAFSYVPNLMRFAGIAAAATWSAGVLELLSRPETVTDTASRLDPHYVDVDLWIQEVVLMLLITAMLSIVVARSRRLVAREVTAGRERANLARYFPPSMVERLAGQDEMLGASRVQPVAVLFADLVGFTSLAETLPPEQVIDLLRRFDAEMEAAVFEHHGTLDKYLGDGIMATFGTPEAGRRDATNALACAATMHLAIRRWNDARQAEGLPPLQLAVGVHHGDVVLGNVGPARRLEFAVLGDVVNVASRLESATRAHGAETAISEALVEACRAEDPRATDELLAAFAPPRSIDLPGKVEPLTVRFRNRTLLGSV